MTMTGKLVYEETPEDWNHRFLAGWEEIGGSYQTLLFYMNLLPLLPKQLTSKAEVTNHKQPNDDVNISFEKLSIHDYGCALGEGCAVLQAAFPMADIKGWDFSSLAVKIARKRWPMIEFQVGYIEDAYATADVIITSHTVEHLEDPASTVNNLLKLCQLLVVVVPHLNENKHGGHEGTVLLDEWLPEVKPYSYRRSYTTVRKVPNEQPMIETSIVLVWQGDL